MSGPRLLRATSPHAFGMTLPAIEDARSVIIERRRAERGSDQLRRAMIAYYQRHHWKNEFRVVTK